MESIDINRYESELLMVVSMSKEIYVTEPSNPNSVTRKKSNYHGIPNSSRWRHDTYFLICDKYYNLIRSPWNFFVDKVYPLHIKAIQSAVLYVCIVTALPVFFLL